MSTTVQYKGDTLATVSNDTKTLKTAGKYMEGDVSITDNSGSEQGTVWQDAEGYLHLDDESGISLQTKSATPSETAQTIKPDAGYYALDKVNVGAISSTYVGSGITRRSSTDLTVSGATVTVPSGYYSAAASKSVASMTLPTAAATSATSGYTKKATIGRSTSTQYINIGTGYNSAGGYYEISAVANGTAGTPTATKGTVSNHSISVTPSVTNTTGYITGGTKSGTAVSVSASELVSGTLSITQNGTGIDVTDYASVNVNVPTGSPTLKTKNITANGTYNASSDNADGYSSVTVNVPTGGSGGWTLLQTTNLGNLSTSSTTATDTGLTLTASGLNPYDTVAIIISVNTKVAGRHVATIRIYTAYGSSDASVKSGGTTSNVYLNYVLNTSNVLTSRTGTAGYGVYPSTITFSTSNNGTITMPIYYRYSATHTDVIDGNYTARIYGANLYDLIGG